MNYTQNDTSFHLGRVNPKPSYKQEKNRESKLLNEKKQNNLIIDNLINEIRSAIRSAIQYNSINPIKNIISQNQNNTNLLRTAIDSVMSEIINERGDTTLTSLVDNFDVFKAVYNAIEPFYSGLNLDSNRWKNNVLLVAVMKQKPDVVQFLLEHGADPNSQNMLSGTTALMWAVIKGNIRIVDMLLDKRAIVDDEDNDRNTALGLAALQHNQEIANILLCNSADITHENKYGYSIVQLAQEAMSLQHTEKQKNFVTYLQDNALNRNPSFLAMCKRNFNAVVDALPTNIFSPLGDSSVPVGKKRAHSPPRRGGKKRKTKKRKSNKNKKSKKSKKSKRRRRN